MWCQGGVSFDDISVKVCSLYSNSKLNKLDILNVTALNDFGDKYPTMQHIISYTHSNQPVTHSQPAVLFCCTALDDFGDKYAIVARNVLVTDATSYTETQACKWKEILQLVLYWWLIFCLAEYNLKQDVFIKHWWPNGYMVQKAIFLIKAKR